MARRLLYLSFRSVDTVKQWLARRFTKAGLLVLGGLAASAVVGLDTNQTTAYQIFTFLFALLLLSIASCIFVRGRYEAHRKLPRFGTVLEPLTYRIVVQNKAPKRQTGLLLLENLEDRLPSFNEFLKTPEPLERARNPFDRVIGYHRWLWLTSRKLGAGLSEQPLPVLPPGGEMEAPVEILPLKRGPLRLGSLTIARPDPFGLYKSFVTIPTSGSILVLPKRYPLPPIQLPGTRRHQPGGVALASSVGDSEEFLSVRDYRPGDPLRKIHWKNWAKAGRPIVKEYQDEFFVRHALILDTFQHTGQTEIFEEAVSIAASFVSTIQTQESLLDLMFVGTEAYCFTSGRGLAHTDRMLEILASVRPCTDKPFSTLHPLVMERTSLLSGCVCVLLAWDEERKTLIRHLKGVGVPLLVLVVAEDKAPEPPDSAESPLEADDIHRLHIGKIKEGLAEL